MSIYKNWDIEEITGYKPLTTYYMDFSISEDFGQKSIKETFDRNFEQAKILGYKYLTEFVMVCNWKIWEWIDKDEKVAEYYQGLWIKADRYCCHHFKDDELKYFYKTTD